MLTGKTGVLLGMLLLAAWKEWQHVASGTAGRHFKYDCFAFLVLQCVSRHLEFSLKIPSPLSILLRPVLEKHVVPAYDLFETFPVKLEFRKCVGWPKRPALMRLGSLTVMSHNCDVQVPP